MSERERGPELTTSTTEAQTTSVQRWQAEFPYHWDADDLVSRRQLLHFAVYTSGALFAGTALLAVLGRTQSHLILQSQPIIGLRDLPEGEAHYFDYPSPGQGAVLLHLPGGRFVAFSRKCTHLSCAVYYQPEEERLLCPCHEGVFDPSTGQPLAGPPRRGLPFIALELQGDTIFAIGQVPQ